MYLNQFIMWLKSTFETKWFTASDVKARLKLRPQHIYSDLYKCWKMGLLSREKLKGHRYQYNLTNWGKRYAEEGVFFNQDMIYVRLLKYIVDHGDKNDKNWARTTIVPRLMQRFLRGKKRQDIFPVLDMIDARLDTIYRKMEKNRYRYDYYHRNRDLAERQDEATDEFAVKYIEKLLSQIFPK